METTLHRQLKEHFCEPGARIEVPLGRYRIDVVNGDRLVEIQRSGLAAIRDKVNKLVCDGYQVDVVKPLVARKRLIKLTSIDGIVKSRRWSPLKATMLDVFDELLYFTRVFPHPNLRMLFPLVDVEEIRYPGHGRRRRKRKNDFEVKDRLMLDIHETRIFKSVMDLQELLPDDLPKKFDTKELAVGLGVPRHQAQRNAILYRLVTKRQAAAALKKKQPKVKRTIDFDSRLPAPTSKAAAAKKPVRKRKTTIAKPAAKKNSKRGKKAA